MNKFVRTESPTGSKLIMQYLDAVFEACSGTRYNALNIAQTRLQVTPQDSQNCGRNFAKRKQ